MQNPDEIAASLALPGADTTCTNIPLDNEIFFDPALPDNKGSATARYGYAFQYLGNSRNMVDGDVHLPDELSGPGLSTPSHDLLRRQPRRRLAARRPLDDARSAPHAAATRRRHRQFAFPFAASPASIPMAPMKPAPTFRSIFRPPRPAITAERTSCSWMAM